MEKRISNAGKKKILITGAGGYVGSLLTESLLRQGEAVIAFDTFWFGPVLMPHPRLQIVEGDLRFFDFTSLLQDVKQVVHLACISNDPSYELNPQISAQINDTATSKFIEACTRSGIQRFIYASSSSVYGVKQEERVSEDLSLEPLTDYSFYKAKIEQRLKDLAQNHFDFVILRPATLCGPSPRLRLDVIGNIFCAQAFFEKKLTIHGGLQFRPQLHIDDMIRAYEFCLKCPTDFSGSIYNVGSKNYTVLELAETVQKICPFPVEIETKPVVDNRSYRVDSTKFFEEKGFKPISDFEKAAVGLLEHFEAASVQNWKEEKFHNVARLKRIFSHDSFQ